MQLTGFSVLPGQGKTVSFFGVCQSARISGKSVLAQLGNRSFCGFLRSASIKPDSLMPSRIASLISRYVNQPQIAPVIIDTAKKKIACRAISASSAWMFMQRSSVVSNRNVFGGAA